MEEKETKKPFYKYTYTCSSCRKSYGSDKEETGRHLCPVHDLHFLTRSSKVKDWIRESLGYNPEEKKK